MSLRQKAALYGQLNGLNETVLGHRLCLGLCLAMPSAMIYFQVCIRQGLWAIY
ncbi:hypothetical protein LIPSTDRAFT_104922 [Lipomyces starkeyi NRRL Y-11557]|uniref:Uncharacterized protein n=1 Tax=Lipomyces starkeyi NRRL Y-11557 TaxID=675824 RepID=A0A1E3Q6J6_LIPST|nr:hypothetical protein LIPSTDRAFT_104922 [Lipomyces starkeyi NRRL Y-11557]